jgi:hypothetical protein
MYTEYVLTRGVDEDDESVESQQERLEVGGSLTGAIKGSSLENNTCVASLG